MTARRLLTVLSLHLIGVSTTAGQSLVVNGNFEQHTGCPIGPNQLYIADGWVNPNFFTSDYFHICGTGGYSVPWNEYGFQQPHSESAYAGIFLYNYFGFVREYIEAPLSAPLTAGVIYHLEFFVSLFDNARYSTRSIGVYFSDTLVNSSSITLMPFTPQVVNTNPAYPDTANWYPVSGYYTASGGENYLIIGNFNDDANTPLITVNPSGINAVIVHVDDVSLTPATGQYDLEALPAVHVGPVPFSDVLTVWSPTMGASEFYLFDPSGRSLRHERFVGSIQFTTEDLSPGVYLYGLRLPDGRVARGKAVKK